ncbi:hypothetical protein AB0J43_02085 [Nonomuraea fuscirosea]
MIGGWPVVVQRRLWPVEGVSYDLLDGDTLDTLTMGESWDAYPTEQQMRIVLDDLHDGEAICCRSCQKRIYRDARRVGAAEPGSNPYCCCDCWDERLC